MDEVRGTAPGRPANGVGHYVRDIVYGALDGVIGTVAGRRVLLGNRALLEDAGVDVSALNERADVLRADGVMVTGDNRRTAEAVARKREPSRASCMCGS